MGVVGAREVSIMCPTGPCVLKSSGVFFGLVDEFFNFARFVYAVDPFGDCRWGQCFSNEPVYTGWQR